MDLLAFFAQHPNEVLSRETLIDGVWRTRFVGEAVLRNTVGALRRALGDRAANPSYIETITKRGYRLVAPVVGLQPFLTERQDSQANRFAIRWEGREIPLVDGDHLIGRGPDAAFRIDSPEVSRRHARLVVDGDAVTLEDLRSKNGTYRNGRRVGEPERLADGDEIWIGLNLARLRLQLVDERTRTVTECRRP